MQKAQVDRYRPRYIFGYVAQFFLLYLPYLKPVQNDPDENGSIPPYPSLGLLTVPTQTLEIQVTETPGFVSERPETKPERIRFGFPIFCFRAIR